MLVEIFSWFLVLVPGLLFPALSYGYGRILNQKRIELENLISGERFERYIRAYDPGTKDPQDAVKFLFDLNYHFRAYLLPIGIILLVVTGLAVVTLSKAGFSMGLPDYFSNFLNSGPPAILVSIAGAYIWCLFDVLRRFRSLDLTPISLHFVWLRLLVSPVWGGLAATSLKDPADLIVAFGLGAFPLKQLWGFTKSRVEERLKIGEEALQAEGPTLHNIQGMRKEMIERLEEEGITSAQYLANADPIKLLLKTGFEWKVILDIIDQAILFMYIGDKMTKLRPIGIRGSIELLDLGYKLENVENIKEHQQAEKVVLLIVDKLGEDPAAVTNLIQTLTTDPRADFVWTLWGESSWNPEPEKIEEQVQQ